MSKISLGKYPPQFRLIFIGMFFSTLGASMIWPYLMIYASETLSLPQAQVATLMTISAAARIAASFIGGPIIDRAGRKPAMLISLTLNGLVYLFMSHAGTYFEFAILMLISGAVNPLYRIAADAMLADLIPAPQRVDAYALLRLSNNAGVSVGPAIGGFLAATSYTLAFFSAAAGMFIYAALLFLFAHETLVIQEETQPQKETLGGYDEVFRDKAFMSMMFLFILGWLNAALIWVLLPVYAKDNFSISESRYGFIPTANALMVIIFQMPVSTFTQKLADLPTMALGMLFYALGTGSVALGHTYQQFLASMIIVTLGELILVPTSSAYVARLAPPEKRGRYMSIYNLTWGVSTGIGPVLGGLFNDYISPQAIWIFGLLVGLLSALGLLGLYAMQKKKDEANLVPSA